MRWWGQAQHKLPPIQGYRQLDAQSSSGSNLDIEGARMFNRMRTKLRNSVRADSTTNDCLLGTTSLIEDDVYDADGKFLGEIKEILIDARTGCVRHVVLALGGFLGIGRKRFAVPWSAFTPDADYRRSTVDLAQIKFMALPVPQDDPWLRAASRPSMEQIERIPAAAPSPLGRTPPKHPSAFLKLGAAEKENTARLSS